jgi:hypothetical protein
VNLRSGEPLTSWVDGSATDPGWEPVAQQGSLLSQLAFLRTLAGENLNWDYTSDSVDLFEEWMTRSSEWDQ